MYSDLGPLVLSQPALDHTEITDPTRVEYAQISHRTTDMKEGLNLSGSNNECCDINAGPGI